MEDNLGRNLARVTEAEIAEALSLSGEPSRPLDGLVRASVLIPLYKIDDGWQVLYTRRTEHLETHKGQVAFPGGSADEADSNPEATALRETHEEIGISPGSVHILGRMRAMPTNSNFLVTPVVGVIPWPANLKIAEAEVSRVFSVPLAWLADPQHYEIRPFIRHNGRIEDVVFFEPYDGEIIWGVTGRITTNFLELITKRAA